jgi:hypothetical protein
MNTDNTEITFTIQFSKSELETVVFMLENYVLPQCNPQDKVVLDEFILKISESEMDHSK